METVENPFWGTDAPEPREPDILKPLAVVTGAAGGIGASLAHRLVERGYRTILIDIKAEMLDLLSARFNRTAMSIPVSIDLADREAIESAMLPLLREHGPVDLLVNCAGVGLYKPFLEHRRGDHERLLQVNYLAAVEMIRLILPGMLRAGRGQVINVASISAKIGPWGHAAYASSKAALVSLTQTLAAEYGSKQLHFCYVNPGVVDTPYYNGAETAELWNVVGRHAVHADWVAEKMMRLLDRPRLELCVPGHLRLIDLARLLSVRLAHWLVARGSRPRPTAAAAALGRPLAAAGMSVRRVG